LFFGTQKKLKKRNFFTKGDFIMNPNEKEFSQVDWGKFKYWQIWDPIPWWVLDKGKLVEIIVVQLESRIFQMKNEIEQMNKIIEIIRPK
jgi:hypothetical protein